ncbi:MAG TPA: FMN-binding negative transcriptional regulator [Lysobacter sp.]
MYLPRAFAETDLQSLDALARRDRFITLVTVDDGEPTVTHLPVLYRREGDRVELIGHWARPNPQARHAGPALAIFHGPHAYVSPSWYPDKEEAARVPTWNYAVAHLRGTLATFTDEASLAMVVDGLSREHEASVGQDWRFEFERDDHCSQLRGIIGFRFVAEQITLKFKLSQNHPLANRESVTSHLAASEREGGREIAALMRERSNEYTLETKGD